MLNYDPLFDDYKPSGSRHPEKPDAPKFTCPKTGKTLSKPFEDMTVGEYFDETGIDLMFQMAIGMAGPLVKRI